MGEEKEKGKEGMNKLRGYDFWNKICKSPKFVVAPMVDASELTWRLVSRKHGADLAYTPMFHSANFAKSEKYRERHFSTCAQDRPLFVQFCGNDPDVILHAAKFVQDHCDAIDINLGCPQNIAKKGHYGAFLQDEWELVAKIIRHLDQNLKIPITCKIRVFPEVEKTIAYAKMIQDAGCSVLTVHGRLREQKGANTGLADWKKIKLVKEALSIPVIANGNVLYYEDAVKCLKETGVDAVMSAEGNLHNPGIFEELEMKVWDIWDEYINFCEEYPTEMGFIKGHFFKVWHHILNHFPEYREKIGKTRDIKELKEITKALKEEAEKMKESISEVESFPINQENFKKLPFWVCQPLIRRQPTEDEKKIWSDRDSKNAETMKRHFEEIKKGTVDSDSKRACTSNDCLEDEGEEGKS